MGSGKAHKKKKNASTLDDGPENKKTAIDVSMSLQNKNKPQYPATKTGKDWVDISVAIATIGVFIFSVYSWHRQESQFHTDQRAWVCADNFGVAQPYTADRPITFISQIKNTGKTPAFIDGIDYTNGASRVGYTNIFWDFTNSVKGGALAPGESVPILMYERSAIGDADFGLLFSRKIAHYLRGTIRYHDSFFLDRTTTFFIEYSGDAGNDKSVVMSVEPGTMN